MPLADVIIIVVVAILLLLVLGGLAANARRAKADRERLRAQIAVADGELAKAHAEDKGWDRSVMEAAAREVLAERFGSVQVTELALVHVIDRPGTDADQAVFRAETADGEHTVTLGRQAGRWVSA